MIRLTQVAQMVRIDGNQEAIALIRMAIDNDDKARTLQAQLEADIEDSAPKLPSDLELQISGRRWTFGSCSTSGTRLDSRELEKDLAPTNRDFVSFDERLRSFIVHNFPEEAPRYEDLIYVCPWFLMDNELFSNKFDARRFSLLNALKSNINLWRTGQRPVIFCAAIRTFISASDMTASSSMMTPLEPLSPVSVH